MQKAKVNSFLNFLAPKLTNKKQPMAYPFLKQRILLSLCVLISHTKVWIVKQPSLHNNPSLVNSQIFFLTVQVSTPLRSPSWTSIAHTWACELNICKTVDHVTSIIVEIFIKEKDKSSYAHLCVCAHTCTCVYVKVSS